VVEGNNGPLFAFNGCHGIQGIVDLVHNSPIQWKVSQLQLVIGGHDLGQD